MYPNHLTPDEKLQRYLEKEDRKVDQRFEYLKRKHEETGNAMWLVIATKEGFDVDFSPTDAGNYPNDN